MGTAVELVRAGASGSSEAEPLWLELFAHHLEIGAAGFPTIDAADSWPRRSAHYRRLFARHRDASFWFARSEGATIGYAMAHSEDLGGEDAMVLETLSVSSRARGRGVGTRLLEAVDGRSRETGLGIGAVDVMAGNDRARELYVRYGYRPYSEIWMRSDPGAGRPTAPTDDVTALARAAELGLECEVGAGPDDTWVSSDELVGLAFPGAPEVIDDRFGGRVALRSRTAGGPEFDGLPGLVDSLAASGRWTVLFEVPAAPEGGALREALGTRCGFQLCAERLARPL